MRALRCLIARCFTLHVGDSGALVVRKRLCGVRQWRR